METLKLISAPSFPDKRVGHLALTLLLTENTEVLTLVTNSLKVDLTSNNQYIQALSLVSIGNLATQDMARDLASDIEKILRGMSSYLKKKAALATIRLVKKEPELIEHLIERITTLLKDRTHGVLISAIQLIIEVIAIAPQTKIEFKTIVPGLVRLLRNFMSMGYSPEHDVSGVTDPFMQVEIIRLLGLLGAGDEEASDQMNDVLAQVATTTESAKNSGNAILYQTVKTVMQIRSDSGLKQTAIGILGRFLLNRDNNIRYVALNSLLTVVQEDPESVQKHRSTILQCLKDVDISIRQRALDLCYLLVNENTVSEITAELLNYLVVALVEHKKELVSRIMSIVERFAPSKKWRIDNMITMLTIAGNYCDESAPRLAIIFIAQADGLQGYAAHRLYRSLVEDTTQYALNSVSVWCIGEYGEALLQSCNSINDSATSASESYSAVSSDDIVKTLSNLLHIHNADSASKCGVLNALLKFCVRASSDIGASSVKDKVMNAMHPLSKSLSVELQQRATEYIQLLGSQWDQLRPELLSRMPVLDEATMRARRAEWYGSDSTSGSSTPTPSATADVMNLLGSPMTSSSTPAAPSSGSGLLDLDDIFGVGSPAPTTTPTSNGTNSGAVDLSSMLAGASLMSPTPAPVPTTTSSIAPGANMLSPNLLGMSPVSTNNTTPTISSVTPDVLAPINAFEKSGLKIMIELNKPEPTNQSKTELICKFTNTAGSPMTNLVFQAAVPKYLKLEMHPPSSTTIATDSDGLVSQRIVLTNSMQGEKNIMLKLKIAYSLNGSKVEEMAQVSNFPPLY